MVKKTWLLCLLFLFGISAMPVQSQTQLLNPTAAQLAPCGLPTAHSRFTNAATFTEFNMTADCTIGTSAVPNNGIYLHFQSGTFTINGNGHSIIGPSHGNGAIVVGVISQVTSTVLNLNNIIIRNAPRDNDAVNAVYVQRGARLNGRNIIFRENRGAHGAVQAFWGGKVYLENAQFLNNRLTHGTLGAATSATAYGGGTAAADTVLSITNGIFEGNTSVIQNNRVIAAQAATVLLQGCITFRNNQGAIYQTSTLFSIPGVVTDTTTNQADRTAPCPPALFSYWLSVTPQKKPKKTATPRPSATPRPLATTCIDLNQATGIAVRATYGLGSGVQCQRLGGGGIGVQSIVEAGFIDAVDVWGYVEQGVEVCFPQLGELLFLDASMMPRAAAPLASTVVNGMTCGAIETPGSIVLMPRP